MGMHGGGWHGYLQATEEKPRVTWDLLKRVLSYSAPYRWHLAGMLLLILLSSALRLLTPLILRDLIDRTIPAGNERRLFALAFCLLLIPAAGGIITVIQRRLNSFVGEGVIYDLRVALFAHLQRMSLHFFTNTKVGELMSRLNNDVIGAQNAITNTTVSIVTDVVQGAALLAVMLSMEWRLTLISVVVLPLIVLVAQRLGDRLRDISRQQMDANAQMNAMLNETLNISGALLIKLFGRTTDEVNRMRERARAVRDLGVRRAVTGASFFVLISLVGAVGTALVYGLGGLLAIRGVFTEGTIVAFVSYLGHLCRTLQALANATF